MFQSSSSCSFGTCTVPVLIPVLLLPGGISGISPTLVFCYWYYRTSLIYRHQVYFYLFWRRENLVLFYQFILSFYQSVSFVLVLFNIILNQLRPHNINTTGTVGINTRTREDLYYIMYSVLQCTIHFIIIILFFLSSSLVLLYISQSLVIN